MSEMWRISVARLGRDLSEAQELATMLREVTAGSLEVEGLAEGQPLSRSGSSSGTVSGLSARDRVLAAQPIDVAAVPWQNLVAVVPSEAVNEAAPPAAGDKAQAFEVHTGGAVFFLLFSAAATRGSTRRTRLSSAAGGAPAACGDVRPLEDELGPATSSGGGGPTGTLRPGSHGGGGHSRAASVEGIAVLKVGVSRLAMQAEQLANELAHFLRVAAPQCRLVRKQQAGEGAGEWAAALAAAAVLGDAGEELAAEMGRAPVFLLMDYVSGEPLLGAVEGALAGPDALRVLADTGRLLLLDMALGNPDRLPITALGWRGNPSNVLLGAPGSKYGGRAVAIDSCVARRPPELKTCAEDAAVERLAQLVATAPDVAADVLGQALGAGAVLACGSRGVEAFQGGFLEALGRVLCIKGLLEMVHAATSEWTAEFLDDVQPLVPGLKGRTLPLDKLAAGMRTPPHLASPWPGAPSSARASPRGSFHNRDLGSPSPTPGGMPSSPMPTLRRANSNRSGALGRSCAVISRASSGSLTAGTPPLPPMSPSPAASGGGGGGASTEAPESQCDGQGCGPPSALTGPSAVPPLVRSAVQRLLPRTLFSAPGSHGFGEPRAQAQAAASIVAEGHAAGRRLSASDEPSWRAASSFTGPSPQRSPREVLEVRSNSSATLASAVSRALAGITSEARRDEALAERVESWKERLRERGATLAAAIAAWQARQKLERALTTGFLDGGHPIVDGYELSIRLEHLLRRLAALAGAATAEAPACVAPRLFLGGAVAADSVHLLAHRGITHIINATEELLLPPASLGFACMRIPLRDADGEDVGVFFERVRCWIEDALATGGSVLVHCHEGKSRSVALVAAHLMASHGLDLASALAKIRAVRPAACPNAGFMEALLALEERLSGRRSFAKAHALGKRGKPAARVCPVCNEAVGVSSDSLAVHMARRHRQAGTSTATAAAGGSAGHRVA